MKDNVIVTGGAGFIGSHLVERLVEKYPTYNVINLDCLTYAADLKRVEHLNGRDNYKFVKIDIRDRSKIFDFFNENQPKYVFHLAAETHVDRSIANSADFITTNINGTVNLLDAFVGIRVEGKTFLHVSTDEVFGQLGTTGKFNEKTPYDPRSPYSASKASSDHLVKSYWHTHHLPVIVTNCSNNYGPKQHTEKLIPVVITAIKKKQPIPVYGLGLNIRDWIYVKDHVEALDIVMHQGLKGHSYTIGGDNEWTNIDLIHKICDIIDEKVGRNIGTSRLLIKHVPDRKGHDFRYAIDSSKMANNFKWKAKTDFDLALRETIDYYL